MTSFKRECNNCEYGYKTETRAEQKIMYCRKNAPVILSPNMYGYFPVIQAHWFCGQHQCTQETVDEMIRIGFFIENIY